MDTQQKLEILSQDAQYDLSCACGTKDDDRRVRGKDGMWVYPATLPRGGKSIMLKTLMSNACSNDCRYCPLRSEQDVRRCSLAPEDVANIFMDYVRRGGIHGLFLTSGVVRDAETTMDRLVATADLLRRKHRYRGYIHLKVMPGASDGAIESALSVASAVSLNVEAPTAGAFSHLSERKDFERDIVGPIKLISRLTGRGMKHHNVKQTTQFLVGASDEKDSQIAAATFGLYRRLGLNRVYFSAYQRGLGHPSLPGESAPAANPADILTREHRLYQMDFLLRRYRWGLEDLSFGEDGNFSLQSDPKQTWADAHPDYFPIHLRSAGREKLLRVPGLGPTYVTRLLQTRKEGIFRNLQDIGLKGKNLQKVRRYVVNE
ncbi:MAG: radical SAM protein [Phycisphaerae bacterium]|nr:radical SAM protein [Phycisphaerae bacterium]